MCFLFDIRELALSKDSCAATSIVCVNMDKKQHILYMHNYVHEISKS